MHTICLGKQFLIDILGFGISIFGFLELVFWLLPWMKLIFFFKLYDKQKKLKWSTLHGKILYNISIPTLLFKFIIFIPFLY